MAVKIVSDENRITAVLSGEIDHHNAKKIREEIDMAVETEKPAELVMDFSRVEFMDSSGIGLVMGRFKAVSEFEGHIIILNPPSHIKRVMRLSGIDRLAKITNL